MRPNLRQIKNVVAELLSLLRRHSLLDLNKLSDEQRKT